MELWNYIKNKGTLAIMRIKNFLQGKKENLQLMPGSEDVSQTDTVTNFIDKYPTEKSSKELEYEKQNPNYFYQIDDKKYEINKTAMIILKDYVDENQIPLRHISGNNYVMASNEMDEIQKNNLLNRMIETYYDGIGTTFFVEQGR